MLHIALALACALPALAQSPAVTDGLEGALNNDSFVPANLTAEELFLAATAELDANRDAGLETLRAALAASTTGDGLPALDGRLTLGIESAVWRTLNSRPAADVRAWCERFEDLAEETRRTDPAGAERRFPGTRAAVRAALTAVDHALAEGRITTAQMLLARVQDHLALRHLAGLDAEAFQRAALSATTTRTQALLHLPGPQAPRATHTLTGAFDAADELPRPATIPFEFQLPDEDPFLADLLGRQTKSSTQRGPGLGIRPGLAAFGPERVLVQTAIGLHLIDLKTKLRLAVIEPRRLADQAFGRISAPTAARQGGAPGWSHHPLVTDDLVLVVTGRTGFGTTPNALVAIERSSLAPPFANSFDGGATLEALPARARWMLSSSGHVANDTFTEPALLADLEGAEIQPGPVRVDDRLIVQARVLDGEVKTYLVALDLATGTPLWTRLVTKGGAIDDGSRFGQARLPIGSAAPLVALGGRVLCSTNLGVDALFDVHDGRLLWAYKTRRVRANDARFSGIKPVVRGSDDLHASAGEPHAGPAALRDDYDGSFIATAPADSDHVYIYRPGPVRGDTPLWTAPLPIDDATDLVGQTGGELFLLTQSGGERQLVSRQTASGPGAQSILLRRDERFVARPAIGKDRLVISSNRGIFLFDRTRELYLADYLALPGGAGPREAGGEVFDLGDRLLVLGPGTLWVFDPTQ